MLWHAPAFTLAAVATLAIGIAANTTMFTVVDAVLLRTLPVHNPDRLVAIGIPTAVNGHTTGAARGDLLSVPLYRDLRDHNRFVTDLAATGTAGRLEVRIDRGEDEHPVGRYVSGNYFAVLGITAARGRVFAASDDERGNPSPAVVISDGYWHRRFGGASDVVGRDMIIGGAKLTIVGVAPRGFNGDVIDRPTDLWLPISMEPVIDPHGAPIEDRATSSAPASGATGAGYHPWSGQPGLQHPDSSIPSLHRTLRRGGHATPERTDRDHVRREGVFRFAANVWSPAHHATGRRGPSDADRVHQRGQPPSFHALSRGAVRSAYGWRSARADRAWSPSS